MVTDTTGGRTGGEVMAAEDADELVIADISEDDAWLSIGAGDAPTLHAWR